MKKTIVTAGRLCAAALVITAILFAAGCNEAPEPHTDTAFLEGTWANTDKDISFTIETDLSFECTVPIPTEPPIAARVKGNLEAALNQGPNDYFIKGMQTTGDDADYPGNEGLSSTLGILQNILVTLTPNADMTQFDFSTANMLAQGFFGGAYSKQQ
jgi:hypothetical protein